MGIETLQKAALAAGFVMATPDDDPPVADSYADGEDEVWQPASGRWLVPAAGTAGHARTSAARDAMTSAAAWIRHHLPLLGGRAPA